jgi:hypothetical protein
MVLIILDFAVDDWFSYFRFIEPTLSSHAGLAKLTQTTLFVLQGGIVSNLFVEPSLSSHRRKEVSKSEEW